MTPAYFQALTAYALHHNREGRPVGTTKKLWSINALATELDRDRRTIAAALKDVPPDGMNGPHRAWFFSTALALLQPETAAEGELDPAQERARKDRALAIQTEMKNQVTRGELVEIEHVAAQVEREYSVIRTRLLGLPAGMAARLVGLDRAKIEMALRAEVDSILTELSEPAGA